MPQEQHPHNRIAVKTRCVDCGQELGSGEFDRREVATREVESQEAAAMPAREATSLVNANLALPINLAAALNVLSDGSVAYADATQTTPIDQSTGIKPPI